MGSLVCQSLVCHCEVGVTLTLPDRYNIIPDRIHTLDVLKHVIPNNFGMLGDLCPLWIKTRLCVNYVIFHGGFAMDPPPACHSPGVSTLETTFSSLLWPKRVSVGLKILLPIEVYGGSPGSPVRKHLRKFTFAVREWKILRSRHH